MSDMLCALCGKRLPQRSLKYIVHIHIAVEYDGLQQGWDDESAQGAPGIFKDEMGPDASELDELVNEAVSVYLCVHCKKKFTRDLIEGEEEKAQARRELRIVYH